MVPIIDVHAEVGTTPLWGVPFTDAHLLRSMQKYSVERAIVSSTIGSSCSFSIGNAQVAALLKAKNAMMGCVVVNVNYVEQSQEDMRRYLGDESFAGLLLTSGVRDRHVMPSEAEDLLNAHRRFVKPVFVHTFNRESLLAANEMAKAFPIMKFILLTMGGEDWRMATMLAEKTLNLVLEISGSFSPDKIRFAAEHIGSHRMVYGSGLPYTDPACTIGLVEDADISDGDKRNIFESTARRLFSHKPLKTDN